MYNSPAWRRYSKRVIAEVGYCEDTTCDEPITVDNPLTAHHRDGDVHNWDRSNIEVLCRYAHGRADGAKSRRGDRV